VLITGHVALAVNARDCHVFILKVFIIFTMCSVDDDDLCIYDVFRYLRGI
jgi:hypothetical protein